MVTKKRTLRFTGRRRRRDVYHPFSYFLPSMCMVLLFLFFFFSSPLLAEALKMTVLSPGSSHAALEVTFDKRRNESIITDFSFIVSRSGQLSLKREGKQGWLGLGLPIPNPAAAAAAAAATIGMSVTTAEKEEEGVHERIYAYEPQGGSVVLAPEYPGDVVILSLQEAIPVLPPRPSFLPSRVRPFFSKDDGKSKSNSFIIMPGTHILAREGSIKCHAVQENQLTQRMGLGGLRRYQGTGKLAFASYGHIMHQELCHGEECMVKQGHLLAWSENVQILRQTRVKTVGGGRAKVFILQGPGVVYLKSHTVSKFQAWASHIPSQPQNPSFMQAQIDAEGGVLDRGDLIAKYVGLSLATVSGLAAATLMATVLQEGPAGIRKLPERVRKMSEDALGGLDDITRQARESLGQQRAAVYQKIVNALDRVRYAIFRFFQMIFEGIRRAVLSPSFLNEDMRSHLDSAFERIAETWRQIEARTTTQQHQEVSASTSSEIPPAVSFMPPPDAGVEVHTQKDAAPVPPALASLIEGRMSDVDNAFAPETHTHTSIEAAVEKESPLPAQEAVPPPSSPPSAPSVVEEEVLSPPPLPPAQVLTTMAEEKYDLQVQEETPTAPPLPFEPPQDIDFGVEKDEGLGPLVPPVREEEVGDLLSAVAATTMATDMEADTQVHEEAPSLPPPPPSEETSPPLDAASAPSPPPEAAAPPIKADDPPKTNNDNNNIPLLLDDGHPHPSTRRRTPVQEHKEEEIYSNQNEGASANDEPPPS